MSQRGHKVGVFRPVLIITQDTADLSPIKCVGLLILKCVGPLMLSSCWQREISPDSTLTQHFDDQEAVVLISLHCHPALIYRLCTKPFCSRCFSGPDPVAVLIYRYWLAYSLSPPSGKAVGGGLPRKYSRPPGPKIWVFCWFNFGRVHKSLRCTPTYGSGGQRSRHLARAGITRSGVICSRNALVLLRYLQNS